MTPFLLLCIEIALITNSILAIAATIVVITKNRGLFSNRFKEKVWGNIDELEQRVTSLEEKVFPQVPSSDTFKN